MNFKKWKKMLQRIRNIVTFVGRSGYKVSEKWKLLQEDVRQKVNILEEVVTTYQKDVGRRCYNVEVRNILEVNILTLTGRSCYNVSERRWK